ncbi:response regulator [Pokkaliibacter plantistimulans]|uniref:response regulator n=1 Tax=Pokkaliibacter plantistimulans TaxID=1635171 RepID=UPI002677EA95|nr:response regulator [Pokkaliibacter plantistimulans]
MDINLSPLASLEDIRDAIRRCGAEDVICCHAEAVFHEAKRALQQSAKADVTLQLIDYDGYAIRQASSRRKGAPAKPKLSDQLTRQQMAVVSALEKVLQHCRRHNIALVGFSDSLVAVPAHLLEQDSHAVHTMAALEVNTHQAYCGMDWDDLEEPVDGPDVEGHDAGDNMDLTETNTPANTGV